VNNTQDNINDDFLNNIIDFDNNKTSEMLTVKMPRIQLTHELLTPLNAILGFTQILIFEKDQLSESQNDAVQAIHQAGELLLSRISTLFQSNDTPISVSVSKEFDVSENNTEPSIELSKELNILIVDDTKTNRLVIKNMLQQINKVIITEAFDGNNALEMIEEKKPDMVLMDLYMPGLDGFETTRILRNRYPNDSIQIIAMSADSSYNEHQLKDYGFNSFLEKPIRMKHVLQIIKAYKQTSSKEHSSVIEDVAHSLSFALPDKEVLEKIIRFSQQGAYSEIKHYLKSLGENQPEYKKFIAYIQKLLKAFKFNKIITFIKSNPLNEFLQQDEAMLHDEPGKPKKEHKSVLSLKK